MRRWNVIAELMKSEGFKSFVEVGCKEGRTTGYILSEVEDSTVVAIDPWESQPGQDKKEGGEDYAKWDFKAIEEEFWRNVGDHKDRVQMYRKYGDDAAEEVGNQQFDCVFIDAAHDYDSVVNDIQTWYPLVRDGGVLCGHDYQHSFPSVQRAVATMFPLTKVQLGPDSVWMVKK